MKFFFSHYDKRKGQRKPSIIAPALAKRYYERKGDLKKESKKKWILAPFFVLIVILVLFLKLRIKAFEISAPEHLGVETASKQIDKYMEVSIFARPFHYSIFTFNKNKLQNYLNLTFPTFKTTINRTSFRRFSIRFEDRIPVAAVVSENGAFLVDQDGIIVKIVENKIGEIGLPLFYFETDDSSFDKNSVGSLISYNDIFQRAFRLYRRVGESVPLSQAKLSLQRSPWQFEMETQDKWKIFLLFDDGLEKQIDRFQIVLREELKNKKPERYIDLRYGDRVYFQ